MDVAEEIFRQGKYAGVDLAYARDTSTNMDSVGQSSRHLGRPKRGWRPREKEKIMMEDKLVERLRAVQELVGQSLARGVGLYPGAYISAGFAAYCGIDVDPDRDQGTYQGLQRRWAITRIADELRVRGIQPGELRDFFSPRIASGSLLLI